VWNTLKRGIFLVTCVKKLNDWGLVEGYFVSRWLEIRVAMMVKLLEEVRMESREVLKKNLEMCHEVGWVLVSRLFRGVMDCQ
jgi:hypothetical protein